MDRVFFPFSSFNSHSIQAEALSAAAAREATALKTIDELQTAQLASNKERALLSQQLKKYIAESVQVR